MGHLDGGSSGTSARPEHPERHNEEKGTTRNNLALFWTFLLTDGVRN